MDYICQGEDYITCNRHEWSIIRTSMARVSRRHQILAHQAFMIGELHGRDELQKAIAQAIADAEERGVQVDHDEDESSALRPTMRSE